MEIIARTPKQAGTALRRLRRQRGITQSDLGVKTNLRQATISKLEAGEPNTQLRILMAALAALDLELVIRPRSAAASDDIEDLF